MRLLVDAGNTRIKWALVEDGEWLETGALPTVEAARLSDVLPDRSTVADAWCSNVAGEAVERALREALPGAGWHFIVSRERQCGVHNGYVEPVRLGSDRWAALIAARSLEPGACLVVNSGTATTVDALSASGEFLGGLILPGIELMQRSLYGNTAGLQAADGGYAAFPRDTAGAIHSGAVQSTCGAIERQHRLLGTPDAAVVLGGGASKILEGRLNLPLRLVDNLVLHGLGLIARETNA